MQPIHNTGGQPQATPPVERTAPQAPVQATRPATPPETLRPVAAPEEPAKLDPTSDGPSRSQPEASPMGMIVEVMTRGEGDRGGAPEKLVPPVPARYLSALMLQTLSRGEETVNAKS